MFEYSQIEIVFFYGEIIGCHSTGYQAAEIRPIPGDEIIKRFEADEFIFIEVRSISIRFGKVAGRIPETVKNSASLSTSPVLVQEPADPLFPVGSKLS